MKVEEKAISWYEANQRYLMTAVSEVRAFLEARIETMNNVKENQRKFYEFENILKEVLCDMSPLPALETICKSFNLSQFERKILLLCAGMELDGAFASLCASANGDKQHNYPTFGLALSLFPEAHWSALSPVAPLRRWRLIETDGRDILTISPLKLDERVLHYLAGVPYMDEKLIGIIEPVMPADRLVPSHTELAKRLADRWFKSENGSGFSVLQLCGNEADDIQNLALAICTNLGLNLYRMNANYIPSSLNEAHSLIRLWEREAVLSSSALLLDSSSIDKSDESKMNVIHQFIKYLGSALIISSRESLRTLKKNAITIYLDKPAIEEQRMIWKCAFAEHSNDDEKNIDLLVSQFSMSASAIQSSVSNAIRNIKANIKNQSNNSNELTDFIWKTCLINTRPKLETLTQRSDPAADWNDLVLPPLQLETLKNIASHVRQRIKVYEDWGFRKKNSRGLGISVMFSGASGTGKTMAAEVLANELKLDLYRIDLSQVVNKYIGETEKNLRRVFDAAEAGGAILLFDEADALFGKRSEVKDSHDRYANVEISYLLQRMESYRGLAILTTNMKNALDTAFLRRIRFIIEFPFPDFNQRFEIWKRIFPPETPTEGLDTGKLAKLSVAGGIIRNIAMNAAFLAADNREPVRMKHLLHAAKIEYSKLEKSLSSDEIEGWV
jgi:hypothetical protein